MVLIVLFYVSYKMIESQTLRKVFKKSLLGTVEASLCNQVAYFNVFLNFTTHLRDAAHCLCHIPEPIPVPKRAIIVAPRSRSRWGLSTRRRSRGASKMLQNRMIIKIIKTTSF